MVCIYCSHKTKVINSRSSLKAPSTWRRRQCLGCNSIFTTREEIELAGALGIKKPTGRLEPFLRDKLFLSINDSLSHRKTALSDSAGLTDTIIGQLAGLHRGGVLDISVLANTAQSVLARFDSAASVHYRAHYC